jgi:hypothetical protein
VIAADDRLASQPIGQCSVERRRRRVEGIPLGEQQTARRVRVVQPLRLDLCQRQHDLRDTAQRG